MYEAVISNSLYGEARINILNFMKKKDIYK
jgi:hypothetical protein